MNRLELGKFWTARLCRVLPNASVRIATRMAWHLAALSVHRDDDLAALPDAALAQFSGGSRHFLELRDQYLRHRSMPAQSLGNRRAFPRPSRQAEN